MRISVPLRHIQRSAIALLSVLVFAAAARSDYVVQRIVTGLDQPTYVTQAPGDNTSLYITQRKDPDGSVGNIIRYNRMTGAVAPFLDLSGPVFQDGGVLGMAFHPDFQENGLFYVTSFVGTSNRLEEYKVVSGVPALQRTLLRYDNLTTQHTIDWVGFQPGATGAERNWLYVTTGDGGIQANESTFVNNGQNPATVMGKVLRLDVDPSAADAYPADPDKNFAIPAGNPFIADNTGKLKEVFETGHRNPWRASFDRATGDLYVGDVGFNTKEEVDFNKNDAGFASGRDYGWASREGTIETPVAGVGGPQGDSLNPIYEVNHPTFHAVTGGYVYRGPLAELQGKYIFGDFNNSYIRAFNFDRDIDPATFNGATAGISNLSDLTATLNGKLAGSGPIHLPVSFGEDNDGNLYIVGLANAAAGGPWWDPALGTGEIYQIAPFGGDANGDGMVDVIDLGILATSWQSAGTWSTGDFNYDGLVDVIDLGMLATNWQAGVSNPLGPGSLEGALAAYGLPNVAVPEPVTAAWAALAGLMLRRRTGL